MGIQMLALDRHTNVAGLIRLMEYITTDILWEQVKQNGI